MTSLQSKSAGALLAALGTRGHSGITCAAHDGDATRLDITLAPGAWAVLADGTVLADELQSTHISGLSIAGTYRLWLDYVEVAAAYEPVWTVTSITPTPPTSSALDICTVDVGAGGISAIGATEGGLRSLPQQSGTATVPAGVPVLRGPHDATSGYAPGDVVTDAGGLYAATVDVPPDAEGPAPASDPDHWQQLVAPPSAPAGVPVLFGPYTVEYTDIPHGGDKKTLWTPEVGDVLLRLFPDWNTVTQWDQGWLFIGQNLAAGSAVNRLAAAAAGNIGVWNTGTTALDSINDALVGEQTDASSNTVVATGHVFSSSAPVQIMLDYTGGTDPGFGHVDIYALIARSVAP